MTHNKNVATSMIQSWWRGIQTRKKYGIHQLPTTELESLPAFLVGNDPKIAGLESYSSSEEKIALVGTSGLRALSLALTLASSIHIPKLIIVDNAIEVVIFWRKLRSMVENSIFSQGSEFVVAFSLLLLQNKSLYRHLKSDACSINDTAEYQYENQDPILFVKQLIDQYGIERLTNTIKNATIIQQSWTNINLFATLKNICLLNGISKIFAYPSNIAHCVRIEDEHKIFASIEKLSPTLSIITDCNPVSLKPEKVILSEEKIAAEIGAKVFKPHHVAIDIIALGSVNKISNASK